MRRIFVTAALLLVTAAVALRVPSHATGETTIRRGPYLQSSSASSTTIVWETDAATSVELRVSRFPGPPWELELQGAADTAHEIALNGLLPDTEYFYEIAAGDEVLATGPSHRFRTHPAESSPRPFRFMAFGDCGTGDSYQWDLASQIDALVPRADFALLLGDIIYPSGEWENFDPNFFEPYRLSLRNQVWWPTLGNHDIGTQNGAAYVANYVLPTDSGAPGHPSGSERYYSFDHGMAHFVALDFWSSNVSQEAGGAQYDWFVADLEDAVARGKRWIVCFGHSPPYTKGSHDSDTESNLIDVREVWVPVMESHGVDLYLAGHSHVYERSHLAAGDAILQSHPDTYSKIGTDQGTIYVVGGAGGKKSDGSLDHPLMAHAVGGVNGYVVLDVSWNEIRGAYEREDGTATDLFTLRKEIDVEPPRIEEVVADDPSSDEISVVFSEPVLAGTGPGGAENPNAYAVSGGVSVLSADLDSNARAVRLGLSPLSPGASYVLTVNSVADRAAPPNEIEPNSRAHFLGADGSSVAIPEGATWRYFPGTSFPGATWMQPQFDDSAWPAGSAGFGFGDGDDATVLNDMSGSYTTVYVRRAFTVNDPGQVHSLLLRISYDDGFVAFLNGAEVERVNVPEGQDHTTEASAGHEASGFQTFDLSNHLHLLEAGANTLAVEGHNEGVWNSDFSLHPALDVLGDAAAGNQPPLAVARADRETANPPATVRFTAERSTDADGEIVSYLWDFGDGATASGSDVEHVYAEPGLYVAALLVEDDAGAKAIARRTVFLHDHGQNPVASIGASAVEVEPGDTIAFSAGGPSDPDGGPVQLLWDFDDPASGSANLSVATAPSHRFDDPGSYDVSLTVTDDEGAQTAYRLNVGVGEPAQGGDGDGSVDPGAGDADDDSGGGCSVAPHGGPPRADGTLALALLSLGAALAAGRRRALERLRAAEARVGGG